jgi:hypothetical protein
MRHRVYKVYVKLPVEIVVAPNKIRAQKLGAIQAKNRLMDALQEFLWWKRLDVVVELESRETWI